MSPRKKRRVDVQIHAPDSAFTELEQLTKEMEAAGFCKSFQMVLSMGVGGMVAHLGRNGAALFFDRWIAALATIHGHIDDRGGGGELVIPGPGPSE